MPEHKPTTPTKFECCEEATVGEHDGEGEGRASALRLQTSNAEKRKGARTPTLLGMRCVVVVLHTGRYLNYRKLLSLSLFANAHSRDVLVRASVLVSSYNLHMTALKASSYTSPAMRCTAWLLFRPSSTVIRVRGQADSQYNPYGFYSPRAEDLGVGWSTTSALKGNKPESLAVPNADSEDSEQRTRTIKPRCGGDRPQKKTGAQWEAYLRDNAERCAPDDVPTEVESPKGKPAKYRR
ncbi:hypothetical protein DFH06DRAFT_1474637 [Mycena polygramma]|nr:hypothetical protein DFH06DRAFT_1474637 [Mycena polygramma]